MYIYINTARSVLSSVLQIDDITIPFGQFPVVKQFMKEVFEKQKESKNLQNGFP